MGVMYDVVEVDKPWKDFEGRDVQSFIAEKYGHKTVPAIFVNEKLLGGNDTLVKKKTQKMIAEEVCPKVCVRPKPGQAETNAFRRCCGKPTLEDKS